MEAICDYQFDNGVFSSKTYTSQSALFMLRYMYTVFRWVPGGMIYIVYESTD